MLGILWFQDFVVLGKSVTGGDVRGTDRDKAAEALRDREVERTQPDIGAIDPTSSLFGARMAGDPRQ